MQTDQPGMQSSQTPSPQPGLAMPPKPHTAWTRILPRIGLVWLAARQNSSKSRWKWRVAIPFLILGILIPVWRANTGHAHSPVPVVEKAKPIVSIVSVTRGDLWNEVSIPAEFRPYAEAELHAKVSGYVQQMAVDFGDPVKAGQLLATLEVPELKDELDAAQARLQRAQADYHSAHLAYTRLKAVDQQHQNLVAQQELDTAEARDRAAEAAIAGARAEIQKDQTLLDYTHITAPFDGVITHRYADPGALIQAGTTSRTQSLPLFRLADNYRLRLDFPVSVAYVPDIRLGDSVEVRVDTLGGKSFKGVIARFSHQVNEETRTMTTEIDVPNPNLELFPGMYAKVVLRVQRHDRALSVPIDAVSSANRPTVLIVNDRQEIEERPVTLGLETATRYEVTAGLQEGDRVIVGNRSELTPGEEVTAKPITLAEK